MAPILKIVNLMQNMFHIERRHYNRQFQKYIRILDDFKIFV